MLEELLRLLQSNYSLNAIFTGLEFCYVALIVSLIIFTCLSYVLFRLVRKDQTANQKQQENKSSKQKDGV